MTVRIERPPGLRARKKEAQREAIAAAAWRLFGARGFEAVTVQEVARAAGVSEKTVFNYFATKEDLLYHRVESFEDELLAAVRERRDGETALAAFRRFLLQPRGAFAGGRTQADRDRMRRMNRTIAGSPALLAREERHFTRYTASLAALLAAETGAARDDVASKVAAYAMIGVHRALIEHVRRRVLAGDDDPARLARGLRAEAERAFAVLETGLARYAPHSVRNER